MQTELKLNFVDAMRIDMERKELSEASVGKALGISQQAVHKWLERGFPPLSRVDDLRAVLGVDGCFARLSHSDLFGGHTSRTPSPHRVAEPAPIYSLKDHARSGFEVQDAGVNTLIGLLNMLPPSPVVRARVLMACIKIVAAALDAAAEKQDE